MNIENEINILKSEIKTLQSIALEKQRMDFKHQLAELLTTTLPVSLLFTIIIFLIAYFVLSFTFTFIAYLIIFSVTFLLSFTIGTFLSFWQEETGIIRLSIALGKLYNIIEINSLKSRLEQCVDSGIVDEDTFVKTINKIADDYYLFNKSIPNLPDIYMNFLKSHNLITIKNNTITFNAKSKAELINTLIKNLQN